MKTAYGGAEFNKDEGAFSFYDANKQDQSKMTLKKYQQINGMSEIGQIWKSNDQQKKVNKKLKKNGKSQIRKYMNSLSKLDKEVDQTMLQIRRNMQQDKELNKQVKDKLGPKQELHKFHEIKQQNDN